MAQGEAAERSPAADQELLRSYIRNRDESAFRVLVDRHGPLVLAVCRRNTFCEHDAEDAFQATFLVLAESAKRVRRGKSLAAWLYGVALRTSSRVRRAHRRQTRLLEEQVVQYDDPLDELLARHEGIIADEELATLPEKLRAPLVLRYLAGKSNHETAEELGISVAALEGRLKRGKAQLRTRLLRRGVTLAAVIVVLKATRVHACDLPEPLATAATAIACGGEQAAGSIDSFTNTIARQELSTMNALLAPKLIASALISGSVLFAVGAHLAMSQNAGQPRQALTLKHVVEKEAEVEANLDLSSRDSEPLFSSINPKEAPLAGSKSEISSNTLRPAATGNWTQVSLAEQGVDAKPRSEMERIAESRLGDSFEPSVQFVDTPLKEVVDYLQSEAGVTVVLDKPHLDEIGIAEDEPVTVSLPAGMRFESVLDILLDPLGLEAIVKNEVIYLTTQDRAAVLLDTRVYPSDRLHSELVALKGLLTESVHPDSWTTSGGGASISITPSGDLVIRQTFAGHKAVASVLRQLATTEAAGSNTPKKPDAEFNHTPAAGSTQNVDVRAVTFNEPGDALLAQEPEAEHKPWTKRDATVLDALLREYEQSTNELHRKQDAFEALAKETESPLAPQNALRNELDKQQVARLQQELLEVRRLDAVSNGVRPVNRYRDELTAEVESLSEAMLQRTENQSGMQSRRDEIEQLKRELEKVADAIAQLKRKQVIGKALGDAPR